MQQIALGPHIVLTKMPSMIAPDDNYGLLTKFQFIEKYENLSNKRVNLLEGSKKSRWFSCPVNSPAPVADRQSK